MNRRRFLQLTAAAMVAPSLTRATSPPPRVNNLFDRYFSDIFIGFKKNALATGPDYVVCDYPGGTKLKGCCTPSGKTYVSVARMLPAMAECIAARVQPVHDNDREGSIYEIFRWILRKAFDPEHPDFWGYTTGDKPTQRAVEAALVAVSLVRAGNETIAKLSPRERTNINKWLASCTQIPERKNNHAWFTACNQAARLELSRTFPEFQGDENWMLEDLKAMDALGEANSSDGWYTDSPDQPIYDIYNFYVFANFPLMWGQIIGKRYPDWNDKFRARIKIFLDRAPYFFAANGSHPLMGRSLCYRFAVLSPLALAYREKLWPHSPGLLRTIVRRQLEYHWNLGGFDEKRGKLRETFSGDETPVTREPYIDNGHPYWAMLGFAFLGIPDHDPFWTDPEEMLPVEKGDYLLRFEGPKFLLQGIGRTGEVRWIQSQNSPKRDVYRDKYAKFAWSSHFAFNATSEPSLVPPDQALVFIRKADRRCATRAPNGVTDARLLEDGVETRWVAHLGEWTFAVTSRIRLLGEFQQRTHEIIAPTAAISQVMIAEGPFALFDDGTADDASDEKQGKWGVLQSKAGTIGMWVLQGFELLERQSCEGINLIHQRTRMLTGLAFVAAEQFTIASLHYASPKPPDKNEVARLGNELAAKWIAP